MTKIKWNDIPIIHIIPKRCESRGLTYRTECDLCEQSDYNAHMIYYGVRLWCFQCQHMKKKFDIVMKDLKYNIPVFL